MGLFFMGWKPGVGSVLKILKYETDDPLTLANSAYNRFGVLPISPDRSASLI
ncbi:Uncharacterised protein [Brucella intermedia]|nr:Uncharacterised protein [Brucella intermedia]